MPKKGARATKKAQPKKGANQVADKEEGKHACICVCKLTRSCAFHVRVRPRAICTQLCACMQVRVLFIYAHYSMLH